MAYSEKVAERIRGILAGRKDVVEKKMFGGLAFMIRGNMSCGVIGDKLMIRLHPGEYETALSRPHVREMDFTGRPLKGFVYVEPMGFASEQDLAAWMSRALEFVLSLPAK